MSGRVKALAFGWIVFVVLLCAAWQPPMPPIGLLMAVTFFVPVTLLVIVGLVHLLGPGRGRSGR